MYSVKEAASILGISESVVRKLLIEGRIQGRKIGKNWVVTELTYQPKRVEREAQQIIEQLQSRRRRRCTVPAIRTKRRNEHGYGQRAWRLLERVRPQCSNQVR